MSNNTQAYAGKVFLATSGQWGFKLYVDGVEAGGGAGMESEAEAVGECDAILCQYADLTLAERAGCIEAVSKV